MFEKQKRWFQNLLGNTQKLAAQTNLPERDTPALGRQYRLFISDYNARLFEIQAADNIQHKEALTQNLSKEAQYFGDESLAIEAWYRLLQSESDPFCTKHVMRELEALHVNSNSSLSRSTFAEAIVRCGSLAEGEEAAAAIVREWRDDLLLLQLVAGEAEETIASTDLDDIRDRLSSLSAKTQDIMEQEGVLTLACEQQPNGLGAAICSVHAEECEFEM